MLTIRPEQMQALEAVLRRRRPQRLLEDLWEQGFDAEPDPETGDILVYDSRDFETRITLSPEGLPETITTPSGAVQRLEYDDPPPAFGDRLPGG